MSKNILIVDDSEAARSSLQFALKIKKYNTLTASNGREGLDALMSADQVDLIITDMNMPIMNGLEFVKQVRGNSQYKFTPIIVLSTDEEKGKEALTLGASGFVVKSSQASKEVVDMMGRFLS